ncbi:MAG TPA: site-specific DNA-methyltransferase [Chloroflexota bacterium]|nr:site-specific DNA-methyltransferase [Chloroflexota bacterium]
MPIPGSHPQSEGPPALRSTVITGEALAVLQSLPSGCVQAVVTSPPYWSLRDYDIPGQIGLENDPDAFVDILVKVFDEVRRVLTEDGSLWLNIGDSYTSGGRTWRAPDKKNPVRAMSTRPPTPDGLKSKELVGIPWRLAFALQAAGWYLRSDVIWRKPNAMPESVKDRPTRSHEYLFFLTKAERYYYDYDAVRETNDRAVRSVWDINTQPFPEAHFATFPPALVEPCIRLSTRHGDLVLDPFLGSGTVAQIAIEHGRPFIGIELNPEYVAIARRRIARMGGQLFRRVEEVG